MLSMVKMEIKIKAWSLFYLFYFIFISDRGKLLEISSAYIFLVEYILTITC